MWPSYTSERSRSPNANSVLWPQPRRGVVNRVEDPDRQLSHLRGTMASTEDYEDRDMRSERVAASGAAKSAHGNERSGAD